MMHSIRKTKSSFSWLLSMISNSKWAILGLTILQSLMAIFTTLYPIVTLKVLNAVEQKDRVQFQNALVMFACFVVSQLVIWYILTLSSEMVSFSIENRLKRFCLDTWLKRRNIYEYHLHTGELMNILSSDVRTIKDGCITILPKLLSLIIRLIVTIILLYLLLPDMAYIMILGAIFMLLATTLIRKKIKKLHKAVNERDGYVKSYFQEVFQNPILIRSFGVEEKVIGDVDNLIFEHRRLFRKRFRFMTSSQFIISLSFNIAIILGTTLASIQIMDGQLAIGVYVAVAQLIAQLREPLVSLTGFIPRYFTMIASVERVLDINHDMQITDMSVVDEYNMLPVPKEIIFDNVSFSYTDDDDLSLSDFSLTIQRGQHLGIVGQSGGGKSTFLKLLIGVYQHHAGQLIVKYKDHEEFIASDNLRAYRNLFAYVPQSSNMMSGTVRDIVSFSDSNDSANDDRLRKSLKIACALDFVESLPDGLDTPIKEAGEGVSGGQMQRLAIARAIFSDRPFLVLDEATSALDMQTEQDLIFNLTTMTDKTIILVTHRQQALTICDRVFDFSDLKGEDND